MVNQPRRKFADAKKKKRKKTLTKLAILCYYKYNYAKLEQRKDRIGGGLDAGEASQGLHQAETMDTGQSRPSPVLAFQAWRLQGGT